MNTPTHPTEKREERERENTHGTLTFRKNGAAVSFFFHKTKFSKKKIQKSLSHHTHKERREI